MTTRTTWLFLNNQLKYIHAHLVVTATKFYMRSIADFKHSYFLKMHIFLYAIV